ncbi:MAG: LysR family transcriptional regulator [Rhizobiaceae bacterium]
MDWMNLPPLNSLKAFSAVAECGNYTQAADRLNVTHAAVSQQVKALEQRLGLKLVSRAGRSIELTDSGRLLARELELGFEIIGRGVDRLCKDQVARPVQVTMPPAFAVEWLMPKIAEFQQLHPEITLMFNPTSELVDLKPGGIDVAIRYGDRRRLAQDVDTVLVSDMIVTGAPSLVGDVNLRGPASLVDFPWIQELGTNEVADWFTFHGVVPDRPLKINQMPGNLIMGAVRRGEGITYTARAFFQQDLSNGALIELHSEPVFGLYCIKMPTDYQRPAARVFLDWLRTKAETVSTVQHL